jgi:rsbT antagonist protein RsbS
LVVPILKQGDVLIGSVQSALTDSDITDFRNSLADQVGKYRSRAVIIDVSGLDIIDSFTARTLQDIANTVKLKGAAAVVVGIQPQVAFAMVQLGLYLDGVNTALDLDEGLATVSALSAGWRSRGR